MPEPLAARLQLALSQLANHRLQQALEEAEVLLASLEDRQDLSMCGAAHECAGKAAYGLGRYLVAEEHLRHAIELLDELGESRRALSSQIQLAATLCRQGNLRPAFHLSNLALDKARQEKYRDMEANSLICLGDLAWVQGNPQEARDLLVSALEILDELGLASEASQARSSIGVTYAITGEPALAEKYLLAALAQFQQDRDYPHIARCLNNLAGIHFGQRDYSRAREYLLQCVELEAELGASGDMASSWLNLGLIEVGEVNTKLVKKYFHRSLQLSKQAGNRGIEGASLLHLGLVSLFDGEYVEANNYAQLAQASFAGSVSQHTQGIKYYLPVFYLAAGDLPAANNAWQAVDCGNVSDQVELRNLVLLLQHLARTYQDHDPATASTVRECARCWAAELERHNPGWAEEIPHRSSDKEIPGDNG